MTVQSQKGKGVSRKADSRTYARIRIQKKQRAKDIRQLIDRVDYDRGAAISEKHLRQGAFSPSKKVKDLSPESMELVKAGQYAYLPSLYEQGARLGKTADPRTSDKHRTIRAGISAAIDETIRLRCAQIAAAKGAGLTADVVYRRRRKLCAAYLVGQGWTLDKAKEYVHADTMDSDIHIRDTLSSIVQSIVTH
jgi:hypothetical protein